MIREYIVLDAPSNLGLRPPMLNQQPGVYKLADAIRNCNFLEKLNAQDAGRIIPPLYNPHWSAKTGTRNAESIQKYSVELASKIDELMINQAIPILLGGDCSILLGPSLSLKKRGNYGLIFFDAHSDFRHPNNSENITSAAGEDLAIVTGRGDKRLININGLMPYFDDTNVLVVGVRDSDPYITEMENNGISVLTAQKINSQTHMETMQQLNSWLLSKKLDGFWLHLDLDVLDGELLPAVDCPEPNGLSYQSLEYLLCKLKSSSLMAGMDITIFDPDLDSSGEYAGKITDVLVSALKS